MSCLANWTCGFFCHVIAYSVITADAHELGFYFCLLSSCTVSDDDDVLFILCEKKKGPTTNKLCTYSSYKNISCVKSKTLASCTMSFCFVFCFFARLHLFYFFIIISHQWFMNHDPLYKTTAFKSFRLPLPSKSDKPWLCCPFITLYLSAPQKKKSGNP